MLALAVRFRFCLGLCSALTIRERLSAAQLLSGLRPTASEPVCESRAADSKGVSVASRADSIANFDADQTFVLFFTR